MTGAIKNDQGEQSGCGHQKSAAVRGVDRAQPKYSRKEKKKNERFY